MNVSGDERSMTLEQRQHLSQRARAIVELNDGKVTPRGEWLSEQVDLGIITIEEAMECLLEDVLLIQIRQIREAKNRVLEK